MRSCLRRGRECDTNYILSLGKETKKCKVQNDHVNSITKQELLYYDAFGMK